MSSFDRFYTGPKMSTYSFHLTLSLVGKTPEVLRNMPRVLREQTRNASNPCVCFVFSGAGEWFLEERSDQGLKGCKRGNGRRPLILREWESMRERTQMVCSILTTADLWKNFKVIQNKAQDMQICTYEHSEVVSVAFIRWSKETGIPDEISAAIGASRAPEAVIWLDWQIEEMTVAAKWRITTGGWRLEILWGGELLLIMQHTCEKQGP